MPQAEADDLVTTTFSCVVSYGAKERCNATGSAKHLDYTGGTMERPKLGSSDSTCRFCAMRASHPVVVNDPIAYNEQALRLVGFRPCFSHIANPLGNVAHLPKY